MGVFDESERRRGKASQGRSRVRAARRPWPLSARLLFGIMFVLNILLAAFLIRNEIKRPVKSVAVPAATTPLTLEGPKTVPSPQLNSPGNAPADEGSSVDLKSPPVEATPAALPGTQLAKRPASRTLRAGKTLRPDLPATMPRDVVHTSQEPPGQAPAVGRAPAVSPGTSAHAAPPGLATPFGTAGARIPGNAAPASNAPAASGPAAAAVLGPTAIGHSLTAKGNRPGAMNKVASVGLPSMETGVVKPKMPVGRTEIEIIPRPTGKLENCSDDETFIACPVLQTRPETPVPSEDN